MTKAPERIRAWVSYAGTCDGIWVSHSVNLAPDRKPPDAEYIRYDLYQDIMKENTELKEILAEYGDWQ